MKFNDCAWRGGKDNDDDDNDDIVLVDNKNNNAASNDDYNDEYADDYDDKNYNKHMIEINELKLSKNIPRLLPCVGSLCDRLYLSMRHKTAHNDEA